MFHNLGIRYLSSHGCSDNVDCDATKPPYISIVKLLSYPHLEMILNSDNILLENLLFLVVATSFLLLGWA